MEAAFDIDGLGKCLSEFTGSLARYLTNDILPPQEIADPLWRAHKIMRSVLEELHRSYGFVETGWTLYKPTPFGETDE
jgi:hypothetical protein